MQGTTHIELSGILTKDAELRYTPSGLAILELSLAGSTPTPTYDGTPARTTTWYHRATTFGTFAETIADDVKAGTAVYLTGTLRFREWTSQQGEKRNTVDVHVSTLKILAPPPTDRIRTDAKGQGILLGATNRVLLMGNATRAPELRYTSNGNPVTNPGLAVNEKIKDNEITGFYNLTAWGALAESLAQSVQKGAPIVATGKLTSDSWTDRDGNRRFGTGITIDTYELVARPNDTPSAARPAAPAPAATTATAPQEPQRPTTPMGQPSIEDEFPPEEDLPF